MYCLAHILKNKSTICFTLSNSSFPDVNGNYTRVTVNVNRNRNRKAVTNTSEEDYEAIYI